MLLLWRFCCTVFSVYGSGCWAMCHSKTKTQKTTQHNTHSSEKDNAQDKRIQWPCSCDSSGRGFACAANLCSPLFYDDVANLPNEWHLTVVYISIPYIYIKYNRVRGSVTQCPEQHVLSIQKPHTCTYNDIYYYDTSWNWHLIDYSNSKSIDKKRSQLIE